MNYRFKKNSDIDAYGDSQNVIHFKFGDARKQYNFTNEFIDKYSGFCKEYINYWNAQESVFKNPFDIVRYIEKHELPVRLYSNYYDEEFEDIGAVLEWLAYEYYQELPDLDKKEATK